MAWAELSRNLHEWATYGGARRPDRAVTEGGPRRRMVARGASRGCPRALEGAMIRAPTLQGSHRQAQRWLNMTERVAAGVEDLPQDVTRHENVLKKKKCDDHHYYYIPKTYLTHFNV